MPHENEYKEKNGKKIYKCSLYSRVVGYLSPISEWNKGKRSEFEQRKTYDIPLK